MAGRVVNLAPARKYANRLVSQDAITRHQARARATQARLHAEGRCVQCGEQHQKPGRTPGTLAYRCERCAVGARAYARERWRRQAQAARATEGAA